MKINANDTISMVSAKTCAKINIDDIEYIESKSRKLLVRTTTQEYVWNARMEDLAPYLVERGFYRAMKSLVINFDKVVRLDSDQIVFESGDQFGMGKNNMAKTRKAYKNYLFTYVPFMSTLTQTRVAEKPVERNSENYA